MDGFYASIILSDEEITSLDDGQNDEWLTKNYIWHLGGYLPESGDDNPSFDLVVEGINGGRYDNWTTWSELPASIQERLREHAKPTY